MIVQLAERDLLQIVPAHGDHAVLYIPKARNELCQRGFAGAGRPYQRRHRVLRNRQAYSVQYFLIVMITEGNIFQLDIMAFKINPLRSVLLLPSLQYLIHLFNGRSHLCQRVHKVKRRYNRSRHAQGKHYHRNKCGPA